MTSVPQAAPRRRSGILAPRRRWFVPAGLAMLAVTWPVFVFTGSQTDYVLSVAAACAVAVALGATRSSLLAGYLIGLVALVGPDVNGQLGNGHAPLGSLRLVDAATAMGAAALLVSWRWGRPVFALRRPGALAVLAAAAVAYATLRWWTEGHRVDGFLRSDVRLIALAALFSLIVAHCGRGGARRLLWSLVVVGLLAAAKAEAIHVSGLYGIGSLDRLQASDLYSAGHLRTILVGGDTLMILVPALAVLLAADTRRLAARTALASCGLACLWALGLSATRTSGLVAVGLTLGVGVATVRTARPRLSRRAIAAGSVITVLIAGVALAGGTASRLGQADAPHVGLNFRRDEVKSFLSAAATTKYLGQGLGGRFPGKDVNGKPALAGWAHELPVWVALKTGVFGLLCASVALGVIGRRARQALKQGVDRLPVLAGVAIVVGLVVISMTLDRVALVEGVLPFVVGVYLVSARSPAPIASDV